MPVVPFLCQRGNLPDICRRPHSTSVLKFPPLRMNNSGVLPILLGIPRSLEMRFLHDAIDLALALFVGVDLSGKLKIGGGVPDRGNWAVAGRPQSHDVDRRGLRRSALLDRSRPPRPPSRSTVHTAAACSGRRMRKRRARERQQASPKPPCRLIDHAPCLGDSLASRGLTQPPGPISRQGVVTRLDGLD